MSKLHALIFLLSFSGFSLIYSAAEVLKQQQENNAVQVCHCAYKSAVLSILNLYRDVNCNLPVGQGEAERVVLGTVFQHTAFNNELNSDLKKYIDAICRRPGLNFICKHCPNTQCTYFGDKGCMVYVIQK